jgi:1,2-dihydroxy-3-keto-5-methylthiopentene dioxygenase
MSESELSIGIKRWNINLNDWENEVRAIAEQEGYTTIGDAEKPEPTLSPEHSHGGDEVRLLLEGSAYFISRIGESEEFVTSHFQAGEMISLPAGVWHKLGPGDNSYKSVRFYHDKATWSKTMRA